MLIADVGGRRLAIRVDDVQEVQAVVRLAPIPGATGPVEGVVDLRGRLVPVIDGGLLFGDGPRPVALSDRLVFVHAGPRVLAIRVDHVDDLATVPSLDVAEAASSSALRLRAAGVARLPDGLVVVHDAGAFLTAEESELVEAALHLAEAERGARRG